jgi:pyruvate/2-oxoglutarate dehydrogenase complex dihydrolipoamide dehydrogenase (E3) component
VALVEKYRMGGDCLNTGCVPSKALIASARAAHAFRHASRWGLRDAEPDFAFEAVMDRVRERRAVIAPHDSVERFESLGVDVFRGEARLAGPHEVLVGDVRLRGAAIVIATGSRAALPDVEGLRRVPTPTRRSSTSCARARTA